MICSKCGTTLEKDDVFCKMCGTGRNEYAVPTLCKCPHCGYTAEMSDEVCSYCGAELKSDTDAGEDRKTSVALVIVIVFLLMVVGFCATYLITSLGR